MLSPPCKGGAGGGSAEGGRTSDSAGSLAALAYPPLAPPFQGGDEQILHGGEQPCRHFLHAAFGIHHPVPVRIIRSKRPEGRCECRMIVTALAAEPVQLAIVARELAKRRVIFGQIQQQ